MNMKPEFLALMCEYGITMSLDIRAKGAIAFIFSATANSEYYQISLEVPVSVMIQNFDARVVLGPTIEKLIVDIEENTQICYG